jgi:hypothetical protein
LRIEFSAPKLCIAIPPLPEPTRINAGVGKTPLKG